MRILFYFVSLCLVATSAYCDEWKWIADKQTGCKVWLGNPSSGTSITWNGKCEDGKANGKGTLQWYNNNKKIFDFNGEYKDGKANGYCIGTLPDGTKFEGEYKDGKGNGRRVTTYPNGDKFECEYKDEKQDGLATYTKKDGTKILGEYKDGDLKRKILSDGTKMEGDINKKGVLNGQGTVTYPNGDKLSGAFSEGKAHGQCTFTFKDGTSYKGLWEHGERIKIF